MERRTTHPPLEPSDSGRATPTRRRPPPPGDRLSLRATGDLPGAMRALLAQGFGSTEAGNLAAYLLGLPRTNHGWTIEEIERLLFVGHLVTRQRMGS